MSVMEERKISEKIDRQTAALEYLLTIVADVENVTALASDYLAYFTDFKLKYNLKDNEEIDDEKASEISEQDIQLLRQKAYNLKANLFKVLLKLKTFAKTVAWDTKEIDEAFKKVENSVLLKTEDVREIITTINAIVQSALLSGVLKEIKKYGGFLGIEEA